METTAHENSIFYTDGYKPTFYDMYPDGTENVYTYLEARGGPFPELVMNGLQPIIKKYLLNPITMDKIEDAADIFEPYFGTLDGVFNRTGLEYIVKEHGGYFPIKIKALPEGFVLPTRNIMASFENCDKKCPWVPDYTEDIFMHSWYPITVATLSREIKKILLAALVKSGSPEMIKYKLHDFGLRGASSLESAEIGGAAHLINFRGSDTVPALPFVRKYYNTTNIANSIPATQHSLMCARGEEGEVEQMRRFLKKFGDGPFPAIACVSDTYNLWRAATEYWGGQLKQDVLRLTDKMLVIRPDSGDPVSIVVQLIETLEKSFGSVVNDKGYRVLNNVRVIQGDGVNKDTIQAIVDALLVRKISIDNIAFGMGGALLQQINRDTCKFKIAASSYIIDGRRFDYQKNPITDSGKRSKAGRLKLIQVDGEYHTVLDNEPGHDLLVPIYEPGKLLVDVNFNEIIARAELTINEPEFA